MEVKEFSNWYKLQSYFNVANHLMISAAAFHMTLFAFRQGWKSITWHIFLTTFGYQLLMAEAIMVFYSPNSWTYFHSYRTKKHLHWILQAIATSFIIAGNVVIIVIKNGTHFKSAHAITGLISLIFLAFSVLQGISTFFAFDIKKFVKPAVSKFFHNLTSIVCFVVGMVSLILGYRLGTMKRNSTDDVRQAMIAFAVITTLLTLIGPAKSVMSFLKKMF